MATQRNGNNKRIETSSSMDADLIKIRHKWIINDFNSLVIGNNYPFGSISSKNVDIDDQWKLWLSVDGSTSANCSLLLQLHLEKCSKMIPGKCTFTILGKDNFELVKSSGEFCRQFRQGAQPISWNIPGSILFDNVNTLVLNNSLTIVCDIIIVSKEHENKKRKCETEEKVIFHIPKENLSDDMESFFELRTGDVTFQFGNEKLQAVKGIISARSSVFAEMFRGKDFADIYDIEYDVFREILFFMYTDRTRKLDTFAKELLVAADKYKLNRLKVMCEEALYKQISNKNAMDTLLLADKHRCPQLKTKTLGYIQAHEQKMLNDDV